MTKPDIERVTRLIQDAPLGQYIGESGARILAERAATESCLKDGEFLYHRGDKAEGFYIVTSGRLAFTRESGGKTHILHVMEEGDLLGELSFIDNTPRTVSACALGEVSVLCFNAEDIQPLVTEHPKMVFDFMRAVIKRVHHTVASIAQQQLELSDYISTGGRGRI